MGLVHQQVPMPYIVPIPQPQPKPQPEQTPLAIPQPLLYNSIFKSAEIIEDIEEAETSTDTENDYAAVQASYDNSQLASARMVDSASNEIFTDEDYDYNLEETAVTEGQQEVYYGDVPLISEDVAVQFFTFEFNPLTNHWELRFPK